MQLQEKVIIVTGAGQGIGESGAIEFAAHGAAIGCVDLTEEKAQKTARNITEAGGKAVGIAADVTDFAAIEKAVQVTVDAFGPLSGAFNCAGYIGDTAHIVECSEENWQRVISINLTGVFLTMRAQMPAMAADGGSIVNVASGAGLVGVSGRPAYVASKHGVVGLTRAGALEGAGNNIRVNAICPGSVRTPMHEAVTLKDPDLEAQWAAAHPLGRIAEPLEIGQCARWLLSDEASFITGAVLPVDGGYTAQ
ncbi:SDR family NAD(P)-dependent oxidoreductase [Hoeflea sp.]|uniref:SDR family NAD(P)-dependent oxidoreductase n=1 Tax=Hoeflea sp. TaxID=1940281 RepID=UPI003B017DC6